MKSNLILPFLWATAFILTAPVTLAAEAKSEFDALNNIYLPDITEFDSPKRILFIGNSFSFYNNGIHNHLGSLIRSAGDWQAGKNRLRLSTLSGGHIYEHLTDLNYYLSKPDEHWEAMVLQGHSNEPIDAKKKVLFEKATDKAISMIKEKEIKPILFMTWGYKGEPDMAEKLANTYIKIANRHDVPVVPVGLAFAQAEKSLADIELFVPDVLGVNNLDQQNATLKYRKVWKHPSEAGTYLAACVFYASLYKQSPEGLIFHGKLSPQVAAQLQAISWQVTSAFLDIKDKT
ncbi:SGNH/GDSL hydrolase family protein [Aliiglaciecola lipolytica]|uniref:DUF4886 domain-containing protein n=1 Tax=Aliiglaciecola lipolytica E3 TaxID=1127673 RepID=K6YVQ8_9ALTE|nr:hypothetical protein [Aliiglaciecola lipolytica]GAC15320.1 hypothetical protein GLIP_2698 [Aliiglaciecola lipolytica E3]